MMIKFGPAGTPDDFYKAGYKTSIEMPKWLSTLGLNAYEYQCSKGVKISEVKAKQLGEEAEKYNISISIHSPYYINLATDDIDKQKRSVEYIMETLNVAKHIGATRIVVHAGSLGKLTREDALENAKQTIKIALKESDNAGFGHIHICPETMGKINQLGDLDEVMELCSLDERLIPTIDFGHLNARTMGGLAKIEDFEEIFNTIENSLGFDRLKIFHSHFSRIEFTKGGEKKHLTFADTEFGPDFPPVAEIVYKKGLEPTFICESNGTMAKDALEMKAIYERMGKS